MKNFDSDVDEPKYYISDMYRSQDSSRSATPQMCFIPTYILSSTTESHTSRKSLKNKQIKDENFCYKNEKKGTLLFPYLQIASVDPESTNNTNKEDYVSQSWTSEPLLPILTRQSNENKRIFSVASSQQRRSSILQDSLNLQTPQFTDSYLHLPSATTTVNLVDTNRSKYYFDSNSNDQLSPTQAIGTSLSINGGTATSLGGNGAGSVISRPDCLVIENDEDDFLANDYELTLSYDKFSKQQQQQALSQQPTLKRQKSFLKQTISLPPLKFNQSNNMNNDENNYFESK